MNILGTRRLALTYCINLHNFSLQKCYIFFLKNEMRKDALQSLQKHLLSLFSIGSFGLQMIYVTA